MDRFSNISDSLFLHSNYCVLMYTYITPAAGAGQHLYKVMICSIHPIVNFWSVVMYVYVCVCVCVCTSEGEANVTLDESEVSVFEDVGSAMLCASLSLTDGFTLETTIIADFNVDIGDTGTLCVCVYVCV